MTNCTRTCKNITGILILVTAIINGQKLSKGTHIQMSLDYNTESLREKVQKD